MKILITGHQGFIGQNMMEALSSEHEVDGLEWNDTLPNLLGYDWVIHLGAITSTTEHDVEKVKENSLKFPKSPYAWSKYLFDRFFEKFAEQGRWNKIKVQGFRYFNVYGPYEDHKGEQASPFHKFTTQAKETGVIKLFEGSDRFFRDFIHVNEVVDIHKKFLKINKSGIFNVGTGKPRSFEDVAKEIAAEFNATIQYIPMPDNLKNQYQEFTCADLTHLEDTLNDVENHS